ncbi:M20 metallopeptidase family protein [Amycolatopsis viridis]|uniref:Hippurate hydrolase n=1 Tax=Amycolatopsis viridis TaxID=185678 RepID=A0ABX0SNK5_9PSEU|nr:M20 family metallopeptidase [Amycolatopsis viridis]NIH78488.1 hippurate hydrolase [Amycolatopsis viridis]
MDILDDARGMQDDLAHLRSLLHSEPEVGLDLPRTQERVLRELDPLGLEITTGKTTSSVVGVLRGGARDEQDPHAVVLRADMDALPVRERTGLAFAATNGAMHACGHDLHTTSLIGAARLLHQHRDRIAGDVVFMFQPGEEGYDGAGIMVNDGVLDAAGYRADAAFALHVFSAGIPRGVLSSRTGPVMSASHRLRVRVNGAGGHGSMPHRAKDPVIAAAEMVTALQAMVTRRFDIFDPVVVTVGYLAAGTKHNVIPDDATFEATVRTFSGHTSGVILSRLEETLHGVAAAHGVGADIVFEEETLLTINTEREVRLAAEVAQSLLGEDRYRPLANPIAASEDFSRVLAKVPGAFLALGATPPGLDPESAPNNHSPHADFDPGVLPGAAAVYAELAIQQLARAA